MKGSLFSRLVEAARIKAGRAVVPDLERKEVLAALAGKAEPIDFEALADKPLHIDPASAIGDVIRRVLDDEFYAETIMQGFTPQEARAFTEQRRFDHDRVLAGELPPFSRAGER